MPVSVQTVSLLVASNVFMTHNTDISDAWEREGEDPRYFYQFSPYGYAVGINVILYAMTH